MNTNSNNRLPACIIAIAYLLLVIATTIFCYRLSITLQHAGMYDFGIFFEKCRHFIETGKLYDRNLGAYAPLEPVYKFPPLSASVMIQIEQGGVMSTTLASLGSWIEVILFVVPTLWLMLILLPGNPGIALLSGALIVTITGPALEENITRLQLEPVLFACCVLSLLALLKRKDFLAGMLIGLATCLKLYPAVMVFYLLVTRRWLGLAGVLAASVLASIYSVAVLGWTENVFFVQDLLPVLLREFPTTDAESVSFATWARWFGMSPASAKILSQGFLLTACALAAHLVLTEKQYAKPAGSDAGAATGFAAFILAMLIGMPNPLWNYQILLVIPLAVIVGHILCDAMSGRKLPGLLLTGGLLYVVLALHIGATSTVDDTYYPATFVPKLLISLSRSLAPFVLFATLFFVRRNTTTSFSGYRPCQTSGV